MRAGYPKLSVKGSVTDMKTRSQRSGRTGKIVRGAAVLLASLMASTLVLGGCSGGGGDTESKLPAVEGGRGGQTLKFTYLRPVWGAATYVKGGAYEKAFEEYANVDIDVQIIPVTEYDGKVKTIVAGGNLPDVMWAAGPADVYWRELEEQGAFADIDKMLDAHPEVKNKVSDTVWQWMRNPDDNKTYFLPNTVAAEAPFLTYYRKDWFEAQNIPEPTTIGELEEALKKIKTAYPDAVPITVGMGGLEWMFKDLATSFGATVSGWVPSEADANVLVPYTTTKACENYFFWLQDLRRSELLDAEAGLNPDTTFGETKFITGKAAVIPNVYNRYTVMAAALKKNDPNAEIGILPPLKGPDGIQGGTRMSSPYDRGLYFSATSKVTEQFFEFWEWYLTDGSDFRRFGVEGEMYKVVDGKKITIPDDERKEDFKNSQVEPLSFLSTAEEQLDFENIWKPTFEANGLADQYDYWYQRFQEYCEVQYPDYLNPTVRSKTSEEKGGQIYNATIGAVYGSILLNVEGTRKEYQDAVADWLERGGQQIIDEINAGQPDKSKPNF